MISAAILIRAYLVVGLLIGAATHATVRASNRDAGRSVTADWTDLFAVFCMAFLWLPSVLFHALKAIWEEIRHG